MPNKTSAKQTNLCSVVIKKISDHMVVLATAFEDNQDHKRVLDMQPDLFLIIFLTYCI